MQSGISLNPCNTRGDSLVHFICRVGNAELLQCLLDLGASVQVADADGRTPLHHACRTVHVNFDLIEILLQEDRRLLHMADRYDALPLNYVRRELWPSWLRFLQSRKYMYWPSRNSIIEGEEEAPPLTRAAPESHPMPDTVDPISLRLAAMVASGEVDPYEAEFLRFNDALGTLKSPTYLVNTDESDGENNSDNDDDDDSDSATYGNDDSDNDISLVLELSPVLSKYHKDQKMKSQKVSPSTPSWSNMQITI